MAHKVIWNFSQKNVFFLSFSRNYKNPRYGFFYTVGIIIWQRITVCTVILTKFSSGTYFPKAETDKNIDIFQFVLFLLLSILHIELKAKPKLKLKLSVGLLNPLIKSEYIFKKPAVKLLTVRRYKNKLWEE